jgi:hypothetical protein
MTKLFLSLDDAVRVAVREFGLDAEDAEIARQELEQKCYVTDNQYVIGYHDGLYDAIQAIRLKAESEVQHDKEDM